MIEKGDMVRVDFNNAQKTLSERARVEYIPTAVGDSWEFLDIVTYKRYFVSEGCTITKQREGIK